MAVSPKFRFNLMLEATDVEKVRDFSLVLDGNPDFTNTIRQLIRDAHERYWPMIERIKAHGPRDDGELSQAGDGNGD